MIKIPSRGTVRNLPPINVCDEEVTSVTTTLPLLHSMINLNPMKSDLGKNEEIKYNHKLLAIRSPESRHSKWQPLSSPNTRTQII